MDNESKTSVRTPWGQLLKAQGVESQFKQLMEEIERLTNRVKDLESQKGQPLPELQFSVPGQKEEQKDVKSNDSQLKNLEERVINLESEVTDIRSKLTQIREKFAILSQEILKKMS